MTDRIRHYRRLRLLYGYATLISLFILTSTLRSGMSVTSMLSLLLLFPIPLYFARKTWRAQAKLRRSYEHASHATPQTPTTFSATSFLTQPNLSFRLSLILLLLTLWTGLARSYSESKQLQANNHPSTFNLQLATNN